MFPPRYITVGVSRLSTAFQFFEIFEAARSQRHRQAATSREG
jgi:hypothetical protein